MDEKKIGRAEDIMASYDITGATCTMKKGAEFELVLADGSKSTLKGADAAESQEWCDALTALASA